MKRTEASVTNFLETREEFRLEMHRLSRLEKQLMELLQADDSAALEMAMLKARSEKNNPAQVLIELFNQQSIIFDRASLKMDCAVALQKQRVEHQQREFDKTFQSIDC